MLYPSGGSGSNHKFISTPTAGYKRHQHGHPVFMHARQCHAAERNSQQEHRQDNAEYIFGTQHDHPVQTYPADFQHDAAGPYPCINDQSRQWRTWLLVVLSRLIGTRIGPYKIRQCQSRATDRQSKQGYDPHRNDPAQHRQTPQREQCPGGSPYRVQAVKFSQR